MSYKRYTVGANFIRPQKTQWLMYIEACRGGYHPPAVYAVACGYSLCRGAATRRPLDASASPKIYLFISVVQHPLCLASPIIAAAPQLPLCHRLYRPISRRSECCSPAHPAKQKRPPYAVTRRLRFLFCFTLPALSCFRRRGMRARKSPSSGCR